MEKSIEQIFEELEQILAGMESGDASLEDTFAGYEAGMRLVKACSEKIDKVEKQIIVLQEGANQDEQE